jgi:hypothetical protein
MRTVFGNWYGAVNLFELLPLSDHPAVNIDIRHPKNGRFYVGNLDAQLV